MASIEVKIKKLDGELARYKEQMGRLRNGPGKVCSPSSFMVAKALLTSCLSHPLFHSCYGLTSVCV